MSYSYKNILRRNLYLGDGSSLTSSNLIVTGVMNRGGGAVRTGQAMPNKHRPTSDSNSRGPASQIARRQS